MLYKSHHLEAISTTTMFKLDLCQIYIICHGIYAIYQANSEKSQNFNLFYRERGEIMCAKVIFENYQAWQTFVRNDCIMIAT